MQLELIDSNFCLKCKGCCRFITKDSIFRPSVSRSFEIRHNIQRDDLKKIKLTKKGDLFYCPLLDIDTNKCKVYTQRPLDCKLYPFLLLNIENKVYLGLDKNCSFYKENKDFLESKVKELRDFLKTPGVLREIIQSSVINRYPLDDIKILTRIEELDFALDFTDLEIKDKKIFENFSPKENSYFDFVPNFMHKGISDVLKNKIDGEYFVIFFFEDHCFCNVFLSSDYSLDKIKSIFLLLHKLNENKTLATIENIPPKYVNSFKKDFFLKESFPEYVYLTSDIATLRGDRFKTIRWEKNYFKKNYKFQLSELNEKDFTQIKEVYKKWMQTKLDEYEKKLALDSFFMLEKILDNYQELDLKGLVLRVNKDLVGFTIGKDLDKDTFLILYEIVLKEFKGAPSFLFTEFAKRINKKFLNCGDDSGIENLKKRKLRFWPKLIKKYTLKWS